MAVEISNVHKNSKLLIDAVPYNVEDYEFMKPGKGRGIYRLKLRNLLDSSTVDRTFHSGDKVEEANIGAYDMQYLYEEGGHYVFMNTDTFDQHSLTEEQLGNKRYFIKEGTTVTVSMMDDRPLDVALPITIELKVTSTDVATKTDTITAQSKTAIMETGYTLQVPAFIKEGDSIKVDTRTGAYLERVSGKK